MDCGPFQLWARRQAGPPIQWQTVADSGSGRQWQWQTVAESDDEEVNLVAATKAQPAETRGLLAEPAVAKPAEPAQMSVVMTGWEGPRGRTQGTRYQCQSKGEGGGGMVAGCDEAREAVERWVDNVCPDVGNTRRCTYMVNPCISLCPSSPNGGTCERMCARQ